MKKLFLAIALTTAASFPVSAGMQHDHSSHTKGTVPDLRTERSEVVESGLSPASGHKMETLETKVDGFDVSFDIMTHKAYQDMMTKMKMGFMKPTKDTTHHIAVTIRKEGQKVEDAKVEAKVISPEGKEEIKSLPYNPDMMFQYVGHFNILKKGKYQVLITFEIGKEKRQGKVIYEVK